MEPFVGAVVGGKYELTRALASGGMGSIWVARHIQLQADVAIKFISAPFAGSPSLRSRFIREARAAAQIASLNVVHVHDYGVEDDTPYLVMELLMGEDLGVRLKREERMSVETLAPIFTQIAKGLRRAHKAGFVHRDLKPSNIFLARSGDDDDDDEVVKILDFGVAKETHQRGPDSEHTKTGEIMGSPHYMSPEQILESKTIDARSDLWALAVILFRAITGELPFPGEAAGLVMSKILTDPIPLPSQHLPQIRTEVDDFFRKAFQRDPEQRFQTALQMAEAFAAAAGGEGAPRLSWTYVGSAFSRNRKRPSYPSSCSATSSTVPAAPRPDSVRAGVASDLSAAATIPADSDQPSSRRGAAAAPLPAAGAAPDAVRAAPDAVRAAPDAAGTLSASFLAVAPESRNGRGRRALFAWTAWGLAAAGAVGAVLGWFLVGFVLNPTDVEPPVAPASAEPPPSAVAPISPAFSVQVPPEKTGAIAASSADASSRPPAASTATPIAPLSRGARGQFKQPRLGF